jgi:hypothetical protein
MAVGGKSQPTQSWLPSLRVTSQITVALHNARCYTLRQIKLRVKNVRKGVLQQQDAVNCGLYMVKALDCIAKNRQLLTLQKPWFTVQRTSVQVFLKAFPRIRTLRLSVMRLYPSLQ